MCVYVYQENIVRSDTVNTFGAALDIGALFSGRRYYCEGIPPPPKSEHVSKLVSCLGTLRPEAWVRPIPPEGRGGGAPAKEICTTPDRQQPELELSDRVVRVRTDSDNGGATEALSNAKPNIVKYCDQCFCNDCAIEDWRDSGFGDR
ncbi:unnamed protein product, partial [Iphiclides podalirius]